MLDKGYSSLVTGLRLNVEQAAARIDPYIRRTPLEPSYGLSRKTGVDVALKLECMQHTRSFKVRGALNKLLSLTDQEKERGTIAASTGNHGMAVAFGLKLTGVHGTIYLPETASERKRELLERYDIDIRLYGEDSADTESYARERAGKEGKVYISPYNDLGVVSGQGTLGIELLEQQELLDAVFVPVGGGGLISGIGAYLKAVRPAVCVIGCLPENSPVMLESIRAGEIVRGTVQPTLSDGTAGGIEAQAITFEMCRQVVDDWMLVSEAEIEAAMKWVFEEHSLVIEGAAGVSVAAFQKYAARSSDASVGNAAIVICGGNVDITRFKEIVK